MSRKKRERTEIPNALQSIDVKAVLRRRGLFLKQRENQRLKAAALPLAEALVKNNKNKKLKKKTAQAPQKYASFSDQIVSDYVEKQIHNVKTLEEHFEKAIHQFLVNHVMAKALSKLDGIVDGNKSVKAQNKALQAHRKKDVFDGSEESDLRNEAQINLEPLLQNMATIAGQDAYKLINIKGPYVPSQALRTRVQNNVEKFAGSMVETDQKHISDLISNGIENGESIQQIRSALTDDFGNYSVMQAQRITRTEVLRAATQSSLDAFRQSGIVDGQQWITAGADDECADYEGEVQTLDSTFYDSGDDPFTDGEPPLHPNCRCILVPVLSDSSIDSSDATSDE